MVPVEAGSAVYNVAVNEATTLNQLFACLKTILTAHGVMAIMEPLHTAFRTGDVRHSQADVSKAMRELGYAPAYRIDAGLAAAVPWYCQHLGNPAPGAGAAVSAGISAGASADGSAGASAGANAETSANVTASADVNHAHAG
jgi:hypothetical protein